MSQNSVIYNTGEFANCLHVNILHFTIKKRLKVIEIKQKIKKVEIILPKIICIITYATKEDINRNTVSKLVYGSGML